MYVRKLSGGMATMATFLLRECDAIIFIGHLKGKMQRNEKNSSFPGNGLFPCVFNEFLIATMFDEHKNI